MQSPERKSMVQEPRAARRGRSFGWIGRIAQRLNPGRVAVRPAEPALALATGDLTAAAPLVPAVVSKAPAQTRLLLVAGDRRFRTVASVLLTRRGYRVTAREDAGDMVEVAAREGTEVVVIEAPSLTQAAREAARLRALSPPIGVVAVSDDPHDGLATFPVLPKWGSFGALFDAIERARDDERRRRAR